MNGLGKYKRALNYINKLEKEKKITKTAQIKKLHRKLKYTGYKLRTLETIRVVSFILLYSSITSAVVSVIPGFEVFSKNIIKFSSLLGSTIFLIIIGITSKLIALYIIDLHLVSSHIISICNKR